MTARVQAPADVRATATVHRSRADWLLAVAMPVGPAAVAVLRYVLPYYGLDGSSEMVAEAAQQPGSQSAVLWLGFVAVLTLVPGVIAAARLSRAAAPRLTGGALALVVPGYLSLGGILYSDQVLWSAAHAGVDPGVTAAMLDNVHPSVDIAIGVFVVGHVVGTVLLGLALLKSRRMPAWSGWALVVSQPLHFVATVILGSPTVDLVAWSLTALAMAMAALALLRDPPGSD